MFLLARRGAGVTSPHRIQQRQWTRLANRDTLDIRIVEQNTEGSRNISTSWQVQYESLPRFFHASRPDFLPSKPNRRPAFLSSPELRSKSIKRYMPLVGAKPVLPSPSLIDSSHAPLYTLLSKQESELAWSQFTGHLRDLSQNASTPIDSQLFDSIFWLFGSESHSSLARQEEIFGRLRILYEYASSQGDYGLTRLQLHRIVYLWTTLWEQHDLKNSAFEHVSFFNLIQAYYNELNGGIASRLASRLLNKSDTHKRLAKVYRMIKRWLNAGQVVIRRKELWEGSSHSMDLDDEVYFKIEERRSLDGLMWEHLLETCVRLPFLKSIDSCVKAAGLLALQQEDLDTSLDIVSQFLALFESTQLFSMLPATIQDGASQIDIGRGGHIGDDVKFATYDEGTRYRILDPIAFILATRLDYRVAQYLLESKDGIESRQSLSSKRTEVFAAGLSACARLSISSQDPTWTLEHLKRGLHMFVKSDWPESRAKERSLKALVYALERAIFRGKKGEVAIQSDEKWMLLLRQFTTVLLTYEARLESSENSWKLSAFSLLLRLHIHLKDYAFAKRLFLVDSMQQSRGVYSTPIMEELDLLWLFQASLSKDTDLRFATQLFVHWMTLTLRWDSKGRKSSSRLLHHLPTNLLRMYVKHLIMVGNKSAVQLLEQHFYPPLERGQATLKMPHQAIRMMKVVFDSGKDHVDFSILLATAIIQGWKRRKEPDLKTLLYLYAIAMHEASAMTKEPDRIIQVLNLFNDFRKQFEDEKNRSLSIVGHLANERARDIYASALRALTQSTDQGEEMHRITEEWLLEMQTRWNISLDWKFWGLRIKASLNGTDADPIRSKELFMQAMQYCQEDSGKQKDIHLPSGVVASLMISLAEKGHYHDAIYRVLPLYKNHSATLSRTALLIVESAEIVVLSMQGKVEEALEGVNNLLSRDFGEQVHSNSKWIQKLHQTKLQLEKQIEEKQNGQGIEVVTSAHSRDPEDRQRSRAYGALASGQPLKWK